MEALVDPAVSKSKFEKEIALYNGVEREYCARGWFLAKAQFPEVFVVFASQKVNPPLMLMGVLLDFTNYDLVPPSVRLVNPFTRVPYKYTELPTTLDRAINVIETPQGNIVQTQPMMQPGYTSDAVPFLCLAGIREYHENPAHTGDSWLKVRGTGVGTLAFILEQISKYGLDNIAGYEFSIGITQVKVARNPPNS